MDFYFENFLTGFKDGLVKSAEEPAASIFDIGGAMFPNVSSQTKWRFARVSDKLHLNDGSHTYSFHLPDGEQEYDFPVRKLVEEGHEFGKDAHSSGTVQVHRADPGSIYFTLQDGHHNPTYTFKHVNAEQWRAIPKSRNGHNKPAIQLDKEAFLKAAYEPGMMDAIVAKLSQGVRGTGKALMATGNNPLMTAGLGLAGGAAYDIGKRTLYNSPEENEQETAGDRLKRYLVPSIGLGLTGTALRGTFPHYPGYQ